MKSVTSGAVKTAIDTINHQDVKYGNYDCNTLGEGVALINEEVLNSPYKQSIFGQNIMYILTMAIKNDGNYRFQLCISYSSNEVAFRTRTDNGWIAWKKIN